MAHDYIQKLFYLLIILCLTVGCQSGESFPIKPSAVSESYKPVVIKKGIENGHPAGIRIAIQTAKETDKATIYKLMSSYQGLPVGLTIVVPREVDGKQKVTPAYIKSLGAPSDLFIQLLAREYSQTIDSTAKMTDSIPFVCMNLNNLYDSSQTRSDGDWIAAEYKLFFDADKVGDDAELFMNIVPGKWIEFAEKDADYRAHLIRLFNASKK